MAPRYARWTETTNAITRHMVGVQAPGSINLAGGLPAPEIYPLAAVEAATRRALARFGPRALAYGPVEGMPELRAAIARRHSSAGVTLGPENVLVTSGGLQALDCIGRVLVEPGEVVLAQFPTYLGALDCWRPLRPRYRRLDWRAGEEAQRRETANAKFVYCVPNFSNPTGALVPLADRERLLAAAAASDALVVEDDPYGALFYDDDRLPSLMSLAPAAGGNVVHLGTLSKSIGPGLRVGWAIGRPDVIARIAMAKQGTDIGTGSFSQGVALELIESGVDRDTQPTMLDTYRRRRDALVAAAREHLSRRFEFEPPVGGMFLWLTAKSDALDTDALWPIAAAEGVMFAPSSVFDPEARLRNAMRLNFTLNDEARIEEGVRRLARAVERALQLPPR